MAAILVLTTFMTGSSLEENWPGLILLIKFLGYGVVLFTIGRLAIPGIRSPRLFFQGFKYAYIRSALLPLTLYFVGLVLGALAGPRTLYSLWQTLSDAIVFSLAFLVIGWIPDKLNLVVRRFLIAVAIWASVLLVGSFILFIGNLLGLWSINVFIINAILMNGPFNHANHLAYVLMTGAFAAGALTLLTPQPNNRRWLFLTIVLTLGILPTFGRGAMLGTAVGLIGILAIRRRRLAILLGGLAILVTILFIVAIALDFPMPEFIPKISFAFRGKLWLQAIQNLGEYGPLGVGAGQAFSRPGLSTHNLFLEQYGEGGILTTLGVLGWLILPIIHIKKSRLDRELAWSIVAMMAGVMVHGIFWTQFLNGLRYLTLVMVCLWTALSTQKAPAPSQTSISVQPSG